MESQQGKYTKKTDFKKPVFLVVVKVNVAYQLLLAEHFERIFDVALNNFLN